MRCSVMLEIQFGKVMSHDMRQVEYLTKRQKRVGVGGPFHPDWQQVEVLPVEYSSLSYYNERLTSRLTLLCINPIDFL